MTSQQLYIEFKTLLNKNGRFTNVDISRSSFITIFNREQERWYTQTINKKKDSDDINDIQDLLEIEELEFIKQHSNYSSFTLPKNCVRFELFEVLATRECTKRINARPITKLRNLNEILANEFSSPSFDWEETIYTISGNKLLIYFSDFEVEQVTCHYYKELPDIDISGYVRLDNTRSEDINPTLHNRYLRQILDRVVLEVQGEIENQAGRQVSAERVATQERIVF